MQEIIDFFNENKGFERVLKAMYGMYTRHGRAFGAVQLVEPSEDEEAALSAFFGRDYFDQIMIRVGLADFERQLIKRFDDLGESGRLGEVLAGYLGVELEKPRLKKAKADSFAAAVRELEGEFVDSPAQAWLNEVSVQSRRSYQGLVKVFLGEPKVALDMLRVVAKALNAVPCGEEPVSLAQFSQMVTGSADTLAFTSVQGKLFLKALACRFGLPFPATTDECIGLHFKAGLLAYGALSCVTARINGRVSVFTLDDLIGEKITCPHVFVIEDPLVFATVCERLRETNDIVICPTFGMNTAFMYLLELCEHATIHYAGNFDYKGLTLADALSRHFPNLRPWRYSAADYATILSENPRPLPDHKKDLALHNEAFASALSLLRKTDKTSSSMPLASSFAEDIKITTQ
jgi:hypothetical protein